MRTVGHSKSRGELGQSSHCPAVQTLLLRSTWAADQVLNRPTWNCSRTKGSCVCMAGCWCTFGGIGCCCCIYQDPKRVCFQDAARVYLYFFLLFLCEIDLFSSNSNSKQILSRLQQVVLRRFAARARWLKEQEQWQEQHQNT